MFNSRWILLAAFVSFSSLGSTEFQIKRMRVQSLMELQPSAPMIAFEAYQRELDYEVRGLSNEARAKNETNLLADKIRQQVYTAYQSALAEHNNPGLAREEIRNAIEVDLEQAAPELKHELLNLALDTLNHIENGGISQQVELSQVEEAMEKEVVSRRKFLELPDTLELFNESVQPTANASKDSEKKDYKNKAELIQSLVSERDSSRWVSAANQTVKTAQVVKTDSKISLQVKMEFLGATIEAGPTISFSRELATNAVLVSEGFSPVIKKDGTFDRVKRERDGSVSMKNGKVVPRYIAFFCDADLKFASDATISGGLKYMGIGTDTTVTSSFQNTVSLQSRRIALPESVQNKEMTVKYLAELCHNDFMRGKYNNKMTVRQSLDVLMKNVVAGLVYANPKTKCAQSSDCSSWFKNEVISLQKKNNVARCVEHKKEKYRFCQLRGGVGQRCPVIENGKRTSSGQGEYFCDQGLRCVKTESATWVGSLQWSYSQGYCKK